MPLLSIARFFATLLSLAILGAAGYLLWSWGQGDWVRGSDGELRLAREDWRLWAGLGLLAWSFLGRFVVLMLAARRDERPTRARREGGQALAGATGSTLHVETCGPAGAPPIVFTHGWGMDSTFWNYAKQDLGDRFRLTVWDLPGLGRSRAASRDSIQLRNFARDLAGLVGPAGGQPVVLVGHSIGGMVIQTLLRDHPTAHRRIAGVVLLNTTYTNPLRTMVFSGLLTALQKPVIEPAMRLTMWLQPLVWASKWQSYLSGSSHLAHRLGFGRFVTRSQLEHVTLLSTRNPPAVEAKGNLAMMNWDASGALDGSPVPVLAIGGDLDLVTKLEASRTIAASAEAGALEVIHGVNHLGPMERADLYNALIAEFALRVQPAVADLRPSAGAGTPPAEGTRDAGPAGLRLS
jgi:pimeloyl-ACP methyl ester carboxylesterase